MASAEPQAPGISLLHRSAAAAGASVVSAVVVNPLDVVKVGPPSPLSALSYSFLGHQVHIGSPLPPFPPLQVRVQAQGAVASPAAAASLLEKWNFAGCGPACVRAANPALPAEACGPACAPQPVYRGTLHALRSIAAAEGVASLWRGTNVALMMAVPMVGIYLPLYDYLLEEARHGGAGAAAPLAAGTLARTAAVYCTAPFELLRTRLQAAHVVRVSPAGYGIAAAGGGGGAPTAPRLLSHLPSLAADAGAAARARALRSLWTGVGATLARDVPFSGLYWAMVEPIRRSLVPPGGARSELEVCAANVVAGGLAGGVSGAITTPLDVVKTRTQLAMGRAHPLAGTLRGILRDEGPAGLFRGWGARSAKAAPACAIVLSAYEMIKFWSPAGGPAE